VIEIVQELIDLYQTRYRRIEDIYVPDEEEEEEEAK
jgi:hypothetical protein